MALLFATILFAILCISSQSAISHDKADDSEQALLQFANHERAAQGLPPLKWSDTLAEAAGHHARLLAQQFTLSHQLPGEPGLAERASRAGARFSVIAENVAEGPNAQSIHRQWMNSPLHRSNLLDRELDSVGIAVADRNDTLFAVEDFSLAAGSMTLREQEKQVEDLLRNHGMRLLNYSEDARRTCTLDNGYTGTHRPSFVVHYADTVLEVLPDLLEKRIRTGAYHSAAVGACPMNRKSAFSGYRIAVMLFE